MISCAITSGAGRLSVSSSDSSLNQVMSRLALLHTLRHTCATMLFRRGLNAVQVQLWLGHHSPAFTIATYVHLLPEDLPDAAFLDDLIAVERDADARELVAVEAAL
jgi:integrase